ncbi:hypothetical protein CHISP_2296 [Chitinispirillum alkaliphilum]|nr:hypothetical protein CHISP_2296 [Chitinispirillum alkaliphilum]
MAKKQKIFGFTLIEVVIVAVIVAVLAGLAIPLYNGYIQDTRQSSVDNLAQAAAAAANSHWRKTGVDFTGNSDLLDKIDIFYDSSKHTIELNGSNITVTHIVTGVTSTVPYR